MTAHVSRITAADLPGLLDRVRAALQAAREEVDALNVFPVPDGDTGTNLLATVQSAVEGLAGTASDDPVEAQVRAASRGALRGAAGNSGVIFSQVVRALAEGLVEDDLTPARLAQVLDRARTLSYDAVAEPLAGTILTAMDAAADAAADAVDEPELVGVVRLVVAAVGEAVAASRDVLEANRRAGVVDAGARGFEVALDGILAFLEGRDFDGAHPPPIRRPRGDRVSRESGSRAYAYEVQYLLEADDEVAGPMRAALEEIGDSVVVVACGGLLNVHVHTNEVEAAMAAGRVHGEPSQVHVTPFDDLDDPDRPATSGPEAPDAERDVVGFVVVAPGAGLARLAREAGVVVVEGRAGDLPSVATVLNAVGTVDADEIVLLPCHPNVVPTMHQASSVSVAEGGRPLHVVEEADSLPAALAVLAVAGRDELDLSSWAEVAGHVRAGEVVPAVRDAQTPLGHVRDGQQLAVVGGVVVAAEDDVVDAIAAVVDACVDDATEVVTLVVGAEVDDDERRRVHDRVEQLAPHVDLEVVDGEQRPARWILGAE